MSLAVSCVKDVTDVFKILFKIKPVNKAIVKDVKDLSTTSYNFYKNKNNKN